MTARATVTQRFANPTTVLAGRRLRVPAAREGRRRPSRRCRSVQRRIEGADPRARARHAPPTSRRRPMAARQRWSSRSAPNVFTTSVAHIGPGEEIARDDRVPGDAASTTPASFRLRFPMVVAPRYIPGHVRRRRRARQRMGRQHRPGAGRRARDAAGRASPDEGFINPVRSPSSSIPASRSRRSTVSYHRCRRRRIGRSSLLGPARQRPACRRIVTSSSSGPPMSPPRPPRRYLPSTRTARRTRSR